MKKNNGFTLVELLVSITIMGIITIMALPSVSRIQSRNTLKKYEKYGETLLTSAKLYTDAYNIDMFGNANSGCTEIPYTKLKEKNLVKDIKINGASCDDGGTGRTYVRVQKIGDDYRYEHSIVCKDKNGKEIYKKLLTGTCSADPDISGPSITFSPDGTTGYKKSASTTINISDVSGFIENIKVKYGWATSPNGTPSTLTTKSFNNKRDINKTQLTINVQTPPNVSGDYYLVVIPVNVADALGNRTTPKVSSKAFKLDNIAPQCTSSGGSTTWTNSDLTITGTCTDSGGSGCQKDTITKSITVDTNDNISPGKVKDNAGNEASCPTQSVKVDKTSPTTPTSPNSISVSGTNTTGTVGTADGSTDSGSGFKEYQYLIKNSSSTPSNTDSGFTTSRNFTRSCGTSYYAWAIAIDNAGNRSTPKYLGTTSDGANTYTGWTECSTKCGDGTQTRTNSCALVTTNLSQNCKKAECNKHMMLYDFKYKEKICTGDNPRRIYDYAEYECSCTYNASTGNLDSASVVDVTDSANSTWSSGHGGKTQSTVYYVNDENGKKACNNTDPLDINSYVRKVCGHEINTKSYVFHGWIWSYEQIKLSENFAGTTYWLHDNETEIATGSKTLIRTTKSAAPTATDGCRATCKLMYGEQLK